MPFIEQKPDSYEDGGYAYARCGEWNDGVDSLKVKWVAGQEMQDWPSRSEPGMPGRGKQTAESRGRLAIRPFGARPDESLRAGQGRLNRAALGDSDRSKTCYDSQTCEKSDRCCYDTPYQADAATLVAGDCCAETASNIDVCEGQRAAGLTAGRQATRPDARRSGWQGEK